jgi:uncharacterized damage-inducible protein DinB
MEGYCSIANPEYFPHAMTTNAYFSQLASYNQWMNGKLYAAAAALPEEELPPPGFPNP